MRKRFPWPARLHCACAGLWLTSIALGCMKGGYQVVDGPTAPADTHAPDSSWPELADDRADQRRRPAARPVQAFDADGIPVSTMTRATVTTSPATRPAPSTAAAVTPAATRAAAVSSAGADELADLRERYVRLQGLALESLRANDYRYATERQRRVDNESRLRERQAEAELAGLWWRVVATGAGLLALAAWMLRRGGDRLPALPPRPAHPVRVGFGREAVTSWSS